MNTPRILFQIMKRLLEVMLKNEIKLLDLDCLKLLMEEIAEENDDDTHATECSDCSSNIDYNY